MIVRDGGLGDVQVEALLRHHRDEARATTPADHAHAMDSSGLAAPGIAFFSAWDGDALLGVCALKTMDDASAELKSMRTHPEHLRKGVGRAMLDHVVGVARARGYRRLYLETGTAPMFAAANALYERHGFVDTQAFGGYPPSPHNRFMILTL